MHLNRRRWQRSGYVFTPPAYEKLQTMRWFVRGVSTFRRAIGSDERATNHSVPTVAVHTTLPSVPSCVDQSTSLLFQAPPRPSLLPHCQGAAGSVPSPALTVYNVINCDQAVVSRTCLTPVSQSFWTRRRPLELVACRSICYRFVTILILLSPFRSLIPSGLLCLSYSSKHNLVALSMYFSILPMSFYGSPSQSSSPNSPFPSPPLPSPPLPSPPLPSPPPSSRSLVPISSFLQLSHPSHCLPLSPSTH